VGNECQNVGCHSSNFLSAIPQGLWEEVFVVAGELLRDVLVCEQGISLRVFQLGYAVDEASVDHRVVEEFFVFFSFFEPLNSGFMSPERFFLFEPFF